MNEDKFNLELRKFLKKVGISSQREIERAIRAAVEQGHLSGDETVDVKATIELPELRTRETIIGTISLE